MTDELNIDSVAANTYRTAQVHPATRRQSSSNDQIKEACRQFEGMMAGIILKHGLKPGIGSENDENNVMQDFAIEETAKNMGQMGALGIADMMYKQMIAGGK